MRSCCQVLLSLVPLFTKLCPLNIQILFQGVSNPLLFDSEIVFL